MPPFKESSFTQNPEENTIKKAEPKDPFLVLGFMFLSLSVVVTIISYGYNSYIQSQNDSLRTEIDAVNVSLAKYPLQEMLKFFNSVETVSSVTKTRNYNTSVFYIIESAAQRDVYFKKFSLTEPNTTADKNNKLYNLNLIGVAPSYRAVVRQIDSLREFNYSKVFKSVTFKKIEQLGEANLSFEIDIEVDTTVPISNILPESVAQQNIQSSEQSNGSEAAPAQENATSTNPESAVENTVPIIN